MNENNEQLKRNTFIKNAHQNLLFATLPTSEGELREFFSRLIEIARLESSTVVEDYVGFDFESLKINSNDAYNDNVEFLEKFKNKLEVTQAIEKRLLEIDFDISLFDFCKVYNTLYPSFLRVFNDYVGFDVEDLRERDYEAYQENTNYINIYMKRGGQIFSAAVNKNSDYKKDVTNIVNVDPDEISESNSSLLAQRKLAHLLDANLFIADGVDSRMSTLTSMVAELVEEDGFDEKTCSLIEKYMNKNISLFEEFQKYLNRIRFELNKIKRMSPDGYNEIINGVLSLTYFGAEWWLERFEVLEQSEIDNHALISDYKN